MALITTYQKRDTPYYLNYLYSGQMYKWEFMTTISGIGNANYIITTSNTGRLFHSLGRIVFLTGLAATIEVYESPTYTTKGVESSGINLDRNSSKTSDTKFFTGGSGYGYSASNIIDRLSIDAVYGFFISRGNTSYVTGITEKIYKPNTDYLVRISNTINVDLIFSITESFYESGN